MLHIKGSPVTPEIKGDMDGKISITGRSIPENPTSFFEPFMNWLSSYCSSCSTPTEFMFHLDYINSLSMKFIFDMIVQLQELKDKGNEVVILWKYDEGDEEILEEGRLIESKFSLNFIFEEIIDN